MKFLFKTLLLIPSVLYCNFSSSQINITPIKSDVSTSVQARIIDSTAIKNEIIQLNQHLEAIQQKWDYILADDELTKQAQESGWFEQMSAVKQQLIDRKNELTALLNDSSAE